MVYLGQIQFMPVTTLVIIISTPFHSQVSQFGLNYIIFLVLVSVNQAVHEAPE